MTVADSEFDEFSDTYQESLKKGVGLSGENSAYFAEQRTLWIRKVLLRLDASPRRILDFGCGTGGSVSHLKDAFTGSCLTGVDPSVNSLKIAQETHGDGATSFMHSDQIASSSFDLAFCNGVFHHIKPANRPAALDIVFNALVDGGYFAFWENNPWNPGTRMVMARIPFDRDAITISPLAARPLLQAAGFRIVRQDFLFWFPSYLSALRPMESALLKIPLGAQYLVLCRKTIPQPKAKHV